MSELEQEYENIIRWRRRHVVRVDQPAAMISQAPRSGGTLLMRLFDGHPECHVCPYEFSFDLRNDSSLAENVNAAWGRLRDRRLPTRFAKGFGVSRSNLNEDRTRHPMLLPPSLHRAIYDDALKEIAAPTDRDVMNAYWTGFFNAWLDNQNLYGLAPKKWVTLFTPRLIENKRKVKRFREIYPDARLISIIRNPVTWFVSAERWSTRGEWSDVDRALLEWTSAAQAILDRKAQDGDELLVLSFEDLLANTVAVTAIVANFLGIEPQRDFVLPSYNRLPVGPNSSFPGGDARVNSAPLDRADVLEPTLADHIRKQALPLYEEVLAVATRP